MSKEKPILFSTPMVQAILEGRKTMTRRVITPQPDGDVICIDGGYGVRRDYGVSMLQPKYSRSDTMWVRETWKTDAANGAGYIYRADDKIETWPNNLQHWRPSIFMPKEAARIFLQVTDVRPERIQDITLEDIEREGIYCEGMGYTKNHPAYPGGMRIHWLKLWDSLNAKRGFGWEENPWVWAYTFEQVET